MWSDSRIREIILNEVYIGNMVQGRVRKINYKSKKSIRLPEKEWKIVKNTHEPIIDNNTFQKANEMLNLRKQTRTKSHDYLLKGLVYCHECGKKMSCSSRHLANGTKYYFRCRTHISNGKLGYCTPHSIRMDYVESSIISIISDLIKKSYNKNNFENLIKTYTNKIEQNQINLKINSYTTELSKITVTIDKLYNDKINNIISSEDFKRIYNSKKEHQSYLKKEIVKLKNFKDNINPSNILEIIKLKLQDNFTITKEILTDFIDKIEIDKTKKLYVYLNFKSIN